jgi:hypothetical protein
VKRVKRTRGCRLSVSFLLRLVYRCAEFSRQSNRSGHTCRAFGADSSLRSRVRLVAKRRSHIGPSDYDDYPAHFLGRIESAEFSAWSSFFTNSAALAQPSVEVGRVYFVTISTPLWLVDVWDCWRLFWLV